MKLLLTSQGLYNQSIVNALIELVEKPLEECNLAYVPTSSHGATGDKKWFSRNLSNVAKLNFKTFQIVDIAVLEEEVYMPIFQQADILYFEGGNALFLLKWLQKTKLDEKLQELIKSKVYVGSSAGSIVTNNTIWAASDYILHSEIKDTPKGLGLVDFYFRPHFNSKNRATINEESLLEISKKNPGEVIYAIDDNSALKIENDTIEIISQGNQFQIFQ
ncbi:MAG: Type 1 glutamine amidotransferase-like domain-containing protein [Candidatus Nanoarchaeia archaeon]